MSTFPIQELPPEILVHVADLAGPLAHALLGMASRYTAQHLLSDATLQQTWGRRLQGSHESQETTPNYMASLRLPVEDEAREDVYALSTGLPIIPKRWMKPMVLLAEANQALTNAREHVAANTWHGEPKLRKIVDRHIVCPAMARKDQESRDQLRQHWQSQTSCHHGDQDYGESSGSEFEYSDIPLSLIARGISVKIKGLMEGEEHGANWFLRLPSREAYKHRFKYRKWDPLPVDEPDLISACSFRWEMAVRYGAQGIAKVVLDTLDLAFADFRKPPRSDPAGANFAVPEPQTLNGRISSKEGAASARLETSRCATSSRNLFGRQTSGQCADSSFDLHSTGSFEIPVCRASVVIPNGPSPCGCPAASATVSDLSSTSRNTRARPTQSRPRAKPRRRRRHSWNRDREETNQPDGFESSDSDQDDGDGDGGNSSICFSSSPSGSSFSDLERARDGDDKPGQSESSHVRSGPNSDLRVHHHGGDQKPRKPPTMPHCYTKAQWSLWRYETIRSFAQIADDADPTGGARRMLEDRYGVNLVRPPICTAAARRASTSSTSSMTSFTEDETDIATYNSEGEVVEGMYC
ncbi:hypothetical protein [Mollivirus kamchatka]|nr:hypothetical protein [Mollivirus kamchatka]